MSVQSDIEEYFKDVDFVVEATLDEQHFLWLTRHHHDLGLGHVEKWDDNCMGRGPTIAYSGSGRKRMPICLSIYYSTLDGLKVAFYSAVSQLIDHRIVQKWIEERTKHITRGTDRRWAHTDVANFHEVIHEIERRNKR